MTVTALALTSCGGASRSETPWIVDRFDDIKVIRYEVPGFEQLPLGGPSGYRATRGIHDPVAGKSLRSRAHRPSRAACVTGHADQPGQLPVGCDPSRGYLRDDVVNLGVEIGGNLHRFLIYKVGA